MDLFDKPFGQRTNLLAQQRRQYYRGRAIIELRYLTIECDAILGSRPLDKRNVKRLLNIFTVEGCASLEPENRVAATINAHVLELGLAQTGIKQEDLFNQIDTPCLFFDNAVRLVCVYGKHRLKAGEAFGEDRWLVELYLSDIPPDSLAQLREDSGNEQDFKDGEIYRVLRGYQMVQDHAQEQKWWTRFKSEDRRKDFRRLQHNTVLCEGFDRLLPYVGLWDPLKAYHIERILGLRCPEYVGHYLSVIYGTWSNLFPSDTEYLIDPASVQLIEGLMPTYSSKDYDRLVKLMEQQIAFPHVRGNEERELLQRKLVETPGRLLSINTLIQDTLYLKQPVKAFRRLLPLRFKGTLREAMLQQWSSQNVQMPSHFQASEHDFRPLPSSINLFVVCMTQLWLFTLRHFIRPHTDARCRQWPATPSTETYSLGKMADLAHQLGFISDKINSLRLQVFDRANTNQMLRDFCTDGFYQINEQTIKTVARHIQDCYKKLKRQEESPQGMPNLVTDNGVDKTRRRYNCPLQDEHYRDRSWLFLEYVYCADQPRARYATSFAVTREICFAFFGKRPLHEIFALEPTTSMNSQIVDTERQPDNGGFECLDQWQETEPVELLPHPPGTPDRDREQIPSSSDIPNNVDIGSVSSQAPSVLNQPNQPQASCDPTPPTPKVQTMDGVEEDIPLAAGFEDHTCKAPLETKAIISLHYPVAEIFRRWYESKNTDLVVFFLFESRTYYKFRAKEQWSMRSLMLGFRGEYYFMTINDNGVIAVNMEQINEVIRREHLILVGQLGGPNQGLLDEYGQISVDRLREYASNFDVCTGKRKASDPSGGRGKRQLN